MNQELIDKLRRLAKSEEPDVRRIATEKLKEAGIGLTDEKPKLKPLAIEKPKKEKKAKKEKKQKAESKKPIPASADGEPDCDQLIKEYHKKEKSKLKAAKARADKPKPTPATVAKHKAESVVSIMERVSDKDDNKMSQQLKSIEKFMSKAVVKLVGYAETGNVDKVKRISDLLEEASNI